MTHNVYIRFRCSNKDPWASTQFKLLNVLAISYDGDIEGKSVSCESMHHRVASAYWMFASKKKADQFIEDSKKYSLTLIACYL